MSAASVLSRMARSNGNRVPVDPSDPDVPDLPAQPPVPPQKQQLEALKARFELLVAAAKKGELGLTFQESGGKVEGLIMAIDLSGAELKLVTVARVFVGTPINIYFG